MDEKIAGLLGAAAAVTTLGGAQAATQPRTNAVDALQTSSYADLLASVPHAVDQLRADNAARAQRPREAPVKVAEDHHHHHHESDQTIIIEKQARHHHHHQQGAFIGIPGVAGVTIGGGDHHDRRDH